MNQPQRVQTEALVDYGVTILQQLGMPAADAALVLDSLVQADLWGHQSHGVLRLPWYAARLSSGAMTAQTAPETLVDGGALLLLDGRAGVGQVLTGPRAAKPSPAPANTEWVWSGCATRTTSGPPCTSPAAPLRTAVSPS